MEGRPGARRRGGGHAAPPPVARRPAPESPFRRIQPVRDRADGDGESQKGARDGASSRVSANEKRGKMKTLVGLALLASLALLAVAAGSASAAPPSGVPANVSPPTISGSPQVGQSLTANPGSWTGKKPITFTYVWRSCDASGLPCADIAGATGAGYTLASADAGRAIRVVVTARNRLGQTPA